MVCQDNQLLMSSWLGEAQKDGGFNKGVSKNRDTSKWMVKIMENPIKMDDLGVHP